jgi:N-methylhydantoinase A
MATRLGVDVGGTFSDLVAYDDETGEVRIGKGPTRPEAMEEGVTAVVAAAVTPALLASSRFFLHGTTVGLNALLERRGAVVGLITTEGFRDLLEIRRGEREATYDPLWKAPPPLVSRELRLTVRERIFADGRVLQPLLEEDVAAALATFREREVQSIAVMFLHAYANPEHELLAERLLRELGFDGEISLSHRISGEFREYERTSTTVIDAYIRPKVGRYLERLDQALRALGFDGSCLLTRSGGGSMTFAEAGRRPFETVMSGPVAGAVGAGELCRALAIPVGVSADVGGTSFDTALILDGSPRVKHEGSLDGMPLQSPWVDVRSIGAGGGSLAYVDEGGLLRVGPASAGATPGPACYGRGAEQATVTDAAAHLGMLADGQLAGGLGLDLAAAARSLTPLADALSLGLDEVARGILTIANAHMADAIRSVALEQGEDLRDATLVAFGGAGPLFATLLASELDMPRVVVPAHAGNFSAWALLSQDITRAAAVTFVRALDDELLPAIATRLRDLRERLAGEARLEDDVALRAALDLRYQGQEYTLTIPVATTGGVIADDAAGIADAFHET